MNIWLLLVLAGLVTYMTRLSFIVLLGRIRAPEWFTHSLRYVPAAVLSALIVPELLSPKPSLGMYIMNPELIAGASAIFVAWKTKNVLLTIGAGMVVLVALKAVFGQM
jgi:branched-subunit amino acid transport protein